MRCLKVNQTSTHCLFSGRNDVDSSRTITKRDIIPSSYSQRKEFHFSQLFNNHGQLLQEQS